MNQIIGGGLLLAGICGISLTAYVYVHTHREARYGADLMGADMMFDGMWLVAMLFLVIGTGLIFQLAWFWYVVLFLLSYVFGGFFAKICLGWIARKIA